MAAGYGCMNDLVIIQTAQGFLRYLEQNRTALLKAEGVVVGYDGRHNSKRWDFSLLVGLFCVAL